MIENYMSHNRAGESLDVNRKCLVCKQGEAKNTEATKNTRCKMYQKVKKYPLKTGSGGFPPKSSSEATALFVLRIHGCLCLEKPLDDQKMTVLGCQMQRRFASGAAARPRARQNPTEPKGEKLWENLGTSKWKFWKLLWPLKLLPRFHEHCGFEMSWSNRVGLYTHGAFAILLSHVSPEPCQLCWQSRWLGYRLKHVPTHKNCLRWGHHKMQSPTQYAFREIRVV